MKLIIVAALALVAVAAAAPTEVVPPKILRSEFVQSPEGGYNFVYETENGITRQETGEVVEGLDADNKPVKFLKVSGSYSYTDPAGNLESVTYLANENGFDAQGPSIPKPARR